MADGPAEQVELERQERVLRLWPVEPVRPDGSTDRSGWLVLTNRRLLFHRRAGLLSGGRLERPPLSVWRLEAIRSIRLEQYWMNVGYGDRVEIPGISVDGQGFRLNRETPSSGVREEIERARAARRAEVGAPLG
jgi:hypothetical protein